ncbi:MAG: hypothetical protein ACE5JP_11320 [Candidatus Bipolaricaulia bacterium]
MATKTKTTTATKAKSAAAAAAEAMGHTVYEDIERGHDRLLLSVFEYKGRKYCHIRTWYFAESDGLNPDDPDNWQPGEGIAIRIEQTGELLDGLRAIMDERGG